MPCRPLRPATRRRLPSTASAARRPAVSLAGLVLVSALGLTTQAEARKPNPVRELVGELTLQGDPLCDGSANGRWVNDRWELGFTQLQGPALAKSKLKHLRDKLVVVRGRPAEPKAWPTVRHTGACPPVPQLRSDWVMGRSGVRVRRGSPVWPAFSATHVARWQGLRVRRVGAEIEVRVTHTMTSPWPDLTIVLHYEGCMGKPGALDKSQRAALVQPGGSVVARFPALAGAERDYRASAVSLRARRGRSLLDLTRSLYREGVSVDCRRGGRHVGYLKPFATKDGSFGYKDSRGKVRIKPRYGLAEPFNRHGVAQVAGKGGLALIDTTGAALLRPYNFDNGPDPFRQGLARFVRGGKVGFYAEDGRVVIPARFDHVRRFSEGRAAFCRGCKSVRSGEHSRVQGGVWGFVDGSGREVIPARWRSVTDFTQGVATVVGSDGKASRVTLAGRPVARRRIRK